MTSSDGQNLGLVARIAESVIGDRAVVDGPFGPRRLVYADDTASGRSLDFVEDFVRERVLPLYANTHTESTATGWAMTELREEARQAIRAAAGAGDDTAVIFCGSGTTGAIDKLIGILQLRLPPGLSDRYQLDTLIPADQRPVVFVGPYEHHSNEISWRETIAEVVEIPADASGHVDLAALEVELVRHADRPQLIGSFSAASNVTGIITDTDAVARVLHRHGALAFFDFAAAAPHLDIAMNGGRATVDDEGAAKDAVFFSPHKFIGGPGTPGVLLVRRNVVANTVPVVPGGGTVSFVTPHHHGYLAAIEVREEGGTPAIVESIRAGLVIRLKQTVGTPSIRQREAEFTRRALLRWRRNPALHVLGDTGAERLPILSFTVDAPSGRLLHHNYVVALLNDLYGIQTRGGCSCAGPYGHRLLGIDEQHSQRFVDAVAEGCNGLKPGWARVTLPYHLTDEAADFVIDAVDQIARQGWRLLDHYRFDPGTGHWRHTRQSGRPAVRLADLDVCEDGTVRFLGPGPTGDAPDLAACARQALALLTAPPEATPAGPMVLPAHCSSAELRWFESACQPVTYEATVRPPAGGH
jgi:selenocysteine lyase/cysteine desulfurase